MRLYQPNHIAPLYLVQKKEEDNIENEKQVFNNIKVDSSLLEGIKYVPQFSMHLREVGIPERNPDAPNNVMWMLLNHFI